MYLTLVPFGLRTSDCTFVEVADVPRGRGCGCICPSCKTPLIARTGTVNTWHFAHATRATFASTQDRCTYSFYVSVRLMAMQLLGSSWQVRLPEMRGELTANDDARLGHFQRIAYKVTDASDVLIEDLKVETTFEGVPVDALGHISHVPFVVYFTHPDRRLPASLTEAARSHARCGILVIALDTLVEVLGRREGHAVGSLKTLLTRFLTTDVPSKSWGFHPRHAAVREQAFAKIDALPPPLVLQQAARPVCNYECLMCRVSWRGVDRACPRCGEVLYTHEVAGA